MTSTESRRQLLLVAGMHRSGTSALCAALKASGASFGPHLLDAMAGVNEEGFWEDSRVVELNEALLGSLGRTWYTVTGDMAPPDWEAESLAPFRDDAREILSGGFGDGPVEVVKDPRFCITLGFWLSVAADCGIDPAVAVIAREPMEVAASLERRDGFPVSYGLRLCAGYQLALHRQAPAATVYLDYAGLIADPMAAIQYLTGETKFALSASEVALGDVVRSDLRHQVAVQNEELLTASGDRRLEPRDLQSLIEARYPGESALREMAIALVSRGRQLTAIGDEHSRALQTLDQRDTDVEQLASELDNAVRTVAQRDRQIDELNAQLASNGEHLGAALDTIRERDEQIREFDRRLAEIGAMHGEALALIEARDAQLQRVFAKPAIGTMFKAVWSRETR